MEMIKANDFPHLYSYIIDNNVSLDELFRVDHSSFHTMDSVDFDILVYSIENNASMEIIDFIIQRGSYYKNQKGYSFLINDNIFIDIKNSPLFEALVRNNFVLATKLIKNMTNVSGVLNIILKPLLEFNSLNTKNLKYILSIDREGKLCNNFIIDIILSSLEYKEEKLVRFIREILNFYIFNDLFILRLLNLYKNQSPMTKLQFNNLIVTERNKIVINDQCYKEAIYYGTNSIIQILLEYDTREQEILINKLEGFRKEGTFLEDLYEDEKYFEEELLENDFLL